MLSGALRPSEWKKQGYEIVGKFATAGEARAANLVALRDKAASESARIEPENE